MGRRIGVDSYTEYRRLHVQPWNLTRDGSPKFIGHDIDRLKAVSRPGQPLIVALQAIFLYAYECPNGHNYPGYKPGVQPPACQSFRSISKDEALCEFFIAINHGATGILWFTADAGGPTPQNTSVVALIDDLPEVWANLQMIAMTMKNGLATALLASPKPTGAARVSAFGGSTAGWWPLDIVVHQYKNDFIITAANPERFPVMSVVFDVSALNIVGPSNEAYNNSAYVNETVWIRDYYLCPDDSTHWTCGFQTDMKHLPMTKNTDSPPSGHVFVDDFPPLYATHYVCKGCAGP